ncbi:carboxylating nicotinate-nucleotide diphosphorylase [Mesorhizobium sp. M7A.F.Ca.US.006.01.1.1]|uniref:carboxylating nicotinate-nucleotide diphosphorylase n=1 Tax=Mesorhizobium sp. M7A.F.Ca.US.006.01.1.1 TaxID=2496707 RepID=UPI000FCB8AFC|nr:carboxylating nicotinate-nucleotide diphosphorylase [Mesorhizobium sp. M7A.F.Ca.US.006.01.1.1]RUZ74243.1 carboxylating nicotinate-nucleotide diphosphorylase [Mesorhizobium sp. M7A.F.Ca.US.006.01.1.1]
MNLRPLPAIMFEALVRAALLEDLGRAGDITTDAIIAKYHHATTVLAARQAGVVAGLDLAMLAFRLIDPDVEISVARPDGSNVMEGEVIASVIGPARAILTAERTALNFLCHLSGVATATASIVAAVRWHDAKIVCTRKTTPGLRAVEKYAVRAGGGSNHRFGLDDAILIKDNHIAIAGGIRSAIERARNSAGHLVKIEVEVDTLAQLEEVLGFAPDAVLLDNMSLEHLRRAVAIVGGRAITEASGTITSDTARAIAATGVDLISIGRLTHSAPILDIGLDYRSS